MHKTKESIVNPYYDFDINLLDCKFLGEGHNGIVYLLPDGNVIKICFNIKSFIGEYLILQRVNGNKYFPRIYEVGENYMIREYVEGDVLPKYIRKHGFNDELGKNIIELLKEFKILKFTKIDLRCKDIFVQPNGDLKVIDPKKFYTKDRDFPRHLSKGMYKLKILDSFLEVLKEEDPTLFDDWMPKIINYIKELKC
ncbi:protein kinase [Clostridium algidicarnis]|uniref:protein kinase n=1 Tax=Clostridium algidicarnis TaxID=37659 RepID=UPI001C0BCBD7|nr:protein kinase [Clostridium algidicarnis]MBU3196090.1 protein kinase [Clostridium algidicarnis]MBU3209132.1 protein kinase [Clostridium algidicarnis]MBU3229031.1 protein kinase [Clostridium algidicarnis]MBU3252550.1 protein kinase [Clostridium algidicarnis]